MRAIVVDHWQEPKDLAARDVPDPTPRAGEVLLEVEAAGCNFFDILLVQGKYQQKPPFPFVPGAEVAGTVRALGADVRGVALGDRVFAGLSLGAFAERVCVPASALHRMPDAMTFPEGAAFPVVYPTSYAALVHRANLRPGETLLVHAAAGGVGVAAVQIGKALGARVIATAGGAEKLEVARRAGADVAIDYSRGDWVEAVKRETSGRGADVIYDPVGGDIFDGSMRCIAWNGRLLVIGFASGVIPEVKANRILLKNISVVGLHWGAYAQHEPERIPEVFAGLAKLYDQGQIRPLIFGTYGLDEVPQALEALAGRATYGKVIIAP
ncbi:MAG TPA: NADPH:quinone oxidoreductase family protein [Myxococcota bacterium]|jgi:NADPH2:quinone reductase|nr:NADPH:quinone oxidoreductase family protein [Myxococcota bacterium]